MPTLENETLNVLVVGNSHSADSINLWYAQRMEVESIGTIKVCQVPSSLWVDNIHRYPERESNKSVFTDQMRSDIKDAVNWTLKHPYELPNS